MASYCFVDLPDFVQVQCNDYKVGGGSAVAFLETDQTSITDYTSASEWNTAIAAGDATVIKDVKVDFPAGTAATQENPVGCGPENIITGFDFTMTFTDPNVSADNDASYAALNGRTLHMVWYECEGEEIRVVERDCIVTAIPATLPASNKAFQVYTITVEWSSPNDWYPVRYTAPTGIFAD
jgi:hypothetical protein